MTTVTNSTIAGNSASVEGGGISSNHSLTLSNSTVSGNSAPLGGGGRVRTLTAINATIAYNRGSGLFTETGVELLHNTIVAGNLSENGQPLDLDGIHLDSASSFNLIGTANEGESAGGLINGTNGNKVGVDVTTVLSPILADNGGPTQTHALLASTTNPAREAGSNALAMAATTDQRGLKRIGGTQVDIGAVELQSLASESLLVVTKSSDVVDGDFSPGHLSLREAILLANESLGGGVTVAFDGVTVVTLTAGEFVLTKNMTIEGFGVTLERSSASGTPSFRLFNVAPSTDVTLVGLTLRSGRATSGGAVFNFGVLTLLDCTVTGNTATQQGGGILNAGNLTVNGCTINNNSTAVGSGGGIANVTGGPEYPFLVVKNSTISGNAAASLGGGLFNAFNATVEDTTIVLNTASAVVFGPSGGGIYTTLDFHTKLVNTIVAGNTIPSDGSVGNDLGGANSSYSENKNNVIGHAGSASGLSGVNGNVVGVLLSNVLDPTLRDNGGSTLTHALVTGSPALDRGDNTGADDAWLDTDQRGQPRITNGTLDIGAFEANPTLLLVDNAGDGVDGNFGPGQLTLREAVQLANTRAGEDTIAFVDSITTVTLTQGELVLSDTARTTLRGGSGGVTIQRDTSAPFFRIFRIDFGARAFLLDLTIANGAAFDVNNNRGGGILNNGTLDLYFCTLRNNSASDGGNLAHSSFDPLLVVNCTLTGGIANRGAGFWTLAGTPQFLNTTISGNRATDSGTGGGIFQVTDAGSVQLINTLVAGNVAGNPLIPNDTNGPILPSSNNNLVGVNTGLFGISNGSNGNKVGTSASPLDPRLGPLRNNGGLTPTFALLPGSPALNAGSNFEAAVLNVDQRGTGFPRLVQDTVDIGAFEADFPTGNPIVVDSTSGVVDGDFRPGQVSLREAILLANDRAGTDTITFAPTLQGQTIALSSEPLRITGPLTITGLGARNLTISGNNQTRIFEIDDGNDGTFQTVTITDLTLTNGRATSGNGGAILNKENLTLSNVTVASNTASGVGGGVAHDRGSLTVTGSTLSGNTAGSRGGAIDANAGSSFQASNSTISGNTSAAQGGGLNLAASGVTLTNLTVTGNRSTSASTNQGGGISEFGGPGQMTLVNTIVAGNTRAGNVPDDLRSNTASTSNSKNNLIGDTTNAEGLHNSGHGNIVGINGSDTRPINTILNTTLADNGPPTLTHALAANSPAINTGFTVDLVIDQTFQSRAVFGFVDIGAVEAPLPTTALIVDSSSDAVDGNFGPGQLTLREAVLIANGRAGADTITFAAALNGQTITLIGGELPVTRSLTVAGPGANLLTIDTVRQSRIFKIDDGNNAVAQTVELAGLRLFRGQTTGNGGAILNRENLTLSNVTLDSNVAQGAGGGVAHERGILRIAGSLVTGNGAGASSGGTIDASAGTSLRVSNSTFYYNLAGTHGGGLNVAGDAVLTHVTLAFNHAAGQGSGIAPSKLGEGGRM